MHILKEFWMEGLYPSEPQCRPTMEMAIARQNASIAENNLTKIFNEEQKALFEEYKKVKEKSDEYENYSHFVTGFRFASRMMMDIYDNDL